MRMLSSKNNVVQICCSHVRHKFNKLSQLVFPKCSCVNITSVCITEFTLVNTLTAHLLVAAFGYICSEILPLNFVFSYMSAQYLGQDSSDLLLRFLNTTLIQEVNRNNSNEATFLMNNMLTFMLDFNPMTIIDCVTLPTHCKQIKFKSVEIYSPFHHLDTRGVQFKHKSKFVHWFQFVFISNIIEHKSDHTAWIISLFTLQPWLTVTLDKIIQGIRSQKFSVCLLPCDVIRYSTLKQQKHTDKKRGKGTVIINQLNCRESARKTILIFFYKSVHRFVRQKNRDVKTQRIKQTNTKRKTTPLSRICQNVCIVMFIRKRNGILSYSEYLKEIFIQSLFNCYCLSHSLILH